LDFWDRLLEADDEQLTENGAVGYKSTGSSLLNLNYIVPSLRKASQNRIMNLFIQAYRDDKMLALKWLFFARDIRQGMGERWLFRLILNGLAQNKDINMKELAPLVPEYGRFDDLLTLLDTSAEFETLAFIRKQLGNDIAGKMSRKPISLMGKWLPSISATNKEKIRLGRKIAKSLGMDAKAYNQMLSRLRSYLDVVECKMSKNQWSLIKYEAVPSKANVLYNRAFFRHDGERRAAYLESVSKGEAKIHAGTLTPADIVSQYFCARGYGYSIGLYDETLEQLWKALPDKVGEDSNSIVVADGSGSMTDLIPGTKIPALAVANALAIYFAERASGIYKDRYITFSMHPQFVDFSGMASLRDKLAHALQYNKVANTNIEAVFSLILKAAVSGKALQSELPKNIIIVSDMEFDMCSSWPDANLFKNIQSKYDAAGYKLPRVVFWNVNSRTNTVPLKLNDNGLCFVSGYSTNILNMVLSGQLDPYQALVDVLNSDRYKPVEAILKMEELNEAV